MAVPKPNSREHDKLKQMMIRRLQMAENQLTSRHDSWKKAERAYRLFVAPEEVMEPKEPITTYQESLYPYPTSVVIPMSYAVAQTLIAFWITQFTGQLPYMRVGNRTPESAGPAKAQELLLSYQLDYLGYIPMLYYWFLDALRYGQGIAKVFWDVREREQTIRSSVSIPTLDGAVTLPVNRKQTIVEYEGNNVEIIDPFTWRPDPRVPIARFQDGLFCGESIYRAYFYLLKKQREGLYENVKEIPFIGRAGGELRGATEAGSLGQSDRDRIMQANRFFGIVPDDEDKGMVLVDEMAIDLIPKDVGVDEGENVERYFVTMGNRATIIRAERYPYDHEEFVYSVIESSPDIHSLMNPGIMELMDPIAQHICYDDQTEILTGKGWKLFKDLVKEDEIAAVDRETHEIRFEKPLESYANFYHGPMVALEKSDRHNFVVTPNHRVWVHIRKDSKFRFVPASSLLETTSRFFFSNCCTWEGQNSGDLVFHDRTGVPVVVAEEWLAEFIGWYVSEGSAWISHAQSGPSTTYGVSIAQKKPEGIALLDKLFSRCSFTVSRTVSATGAVQWIIYQKDFCLWIREHCGYLSSGKKLPDFIRQWSPRLLRLMLQAALCGDGFSYSENNVQYTTTSRKLADHIQECCLKIGWGAAINMRLVLTQAGQSIFDIWIRTDNQDSGLEGSSQGAFCYRDYEGMIYCVRSSTELLLVRRKGKVVICGNTWLFNSHLENVRKSLNDMTLVDPSRVNMDDLLNPSAGKTIRLAESAWGGGLDGVMQQFPVVDVTRGNIETALQLNEILQRFSAATDAVQGQSPQTRGGRARKTATQFNVESQQAGLRLKVMAKMFSAQGLVPLARQMVQNNQSFMSQTQYLKIVGSLEQEYRGIGRAVSGNGIMVAPEDIQGQFDFPIFDGGTPLDPVRFAETWMQLAGLAMQNPILAQRVDHLQLFRQIAASLGVTDISRFVLPQQAQVMPDQQVQQQAQAGNLVPMQNGAAGSPPGVPVQ